MYCSNNNHVHGKNQIYCHLTKCPQCGNTNSQTITYDGGSTLKCNICEFIFKAKRISGEIIPGIGFL